MIVETRNNGIKDHTVIMAEEGKLLARKETPEEYIGEELWLGKSWYINGEKLKEPHIDVPEDFIEVDKPEDWGEVPEEILEEDLDIPDSEALKIIIGE